MSEHRNEKIVVRYDQTVCVHAGNCVKTLPGVFDVSRNPWINVTGATPERSSRPWPPARRVR